MNVLNFKCIYFLSLLVFFLRFLEIWLEVFLKCICIIQVKGEDWSEVNFCINFLFFFIKDEVVSNLDGDV